MRTPAPGFPEPSRCGAQHDDQQGGPPGVHGPAELVETHTSVLIFLEDLVYKVKKPVDLGFLDFRDQATRRAACEAEVELNRRLSPDVYLGVAELVCPGARSPESLVVMRRMPAERRLSTLVTSPSPAVDIDAAVRALGRQLAAFHSRCPTSPEIATAGDPNALRTLWQENLSVLHHYTGQVLNAPTVDVIDRLAMRYLAGREALLHLRQRLGLIRDGHGDLLADDVFVLDDRPRVLDCLEFDDRLRHGDVLNDVAFLAMDLERLGAPVAARAFLDAYAEFSAEHHPRSLEDHYIAYRAGVRCKVACLRWAQGDESSAAIARNYAELAVRHLARARVQLVLVGGLPGTGKSTLAAAISSGEGADWTLLRSDVVRKELAGIRPSESAAAAYGQGIYCPQSRRRTYDEIFTRALHALELGESVVIDASFSSIAERRAAAQLAERTSAVLVELECRAPGALVEERLVQRAIREGRTGEASDADVAIAREMAADADPWPSATRIDTSAPISAIVRAAQAVLDTDVP